MDIRKSGFYLMSSRRVWWLARRHLGSFFHKQVVQSHIYNREVFHRPGDLAEVLSTERSKTHNPSCEIDNFGDAPIFLHSSVWCSNRAFYVFAYCPMKDAGRPPSPRGWQCEGQQQDDFIASQVTAPLTDYRWLPSILRVFVFSLAPPPPVTGKHGDQDQIFRANIRGYVNVGARRGFWLLVSTARPSYMVPTFGVEMDAPGRGSQLRSAVANVAQRKAVFGRKLAVAVHCLDAPKGYPRGSFCRKSGASFLP